MFKERNDEIMKMFINRDNNDIGETIKRCREYNGFTLRELGLLSGFGVDNKITHPIQIADVTKKPIIILGKLDKNPFLFF